MRKTSLSFLCWNVLTCHQLAFSLIFNWTALLEHGTLPLKAAVHSGPELSVSQDIRRFLEVAVLPYTGLFCVIRPDPSNTEAVPPGFVQIWSSRQAGESGWHSAQGFGVLPTGPTLFQFINVVDVNILSSSNTVQDVDDKTRKVTNTIYVKLFHFNRTIGHESVLPPCLALVRRNIHGIPMFQEDAPNAHLIPQVWVSGAAVRLRQGHCLGTTLSIPTC